MPEDFDIQPTEYKFNENKEPKKPSIHFREPILTCKICGDTFKNSQGLGSHKSSKHNMKKDDDKINYDADFLIIEAPVKAKKYDKKFKHWVVSIDYKVPGKYVVDTLIKLPAARPLHRDKSIEPDTTIYEWYQIRLIKRDKTRQSQEVIV